MLTVENVPLAAMADIAGLQALTAMDVLDGTAAIQADLAGGASALEPHAAAHLLGGIGFDAGSDAIALTGAQAAAVADALAWLPAGSLTVTGASVALLDAFALSDTFGRGVPAALTVSDTAAALAAALALGAGSALVAQAGLIGSIAISDQAGITLDYPAIGALAGVLAKLPGGALTVDDVPVAGIAGVLDAAGAAPAASRCATAPRRSRTTSPPAARSAGSAACSTASPSTTPGRSH